MSRNRMKNSQSLHWMGVVKWVLIAGLLAGLGLFYMLSKNYNLHLAEETRQLQLQLDKINARNAELSGDLLGMKSPERLKNRLAQMHSNLVKWGDGHASWVRLDQNTRARLAQIGTMPNADLNLNAMPVTANAAPPGPDIH
jgi:hypothetical protein